MRLGGTIKTPQLSLSVPLAQTERTPNLSQVHQISDLILIAVAIFTVVFQNEVLATRKQSLRVWEFCKDVFRTADTRDSKVSRNSAQQRRTWEPCRQVGVIIMLSVPTDQKSNNYNWGVTTVSEQNMGTFTMPARQSEQEVAHCKCIIGTFYEALCPVGTQLLDHSRLLTYFAKQKIFIGYRQREGNKYFKGL